MAWQPPALQRFQSATECPKCGSQNLQRTYRAAFTVETLFSIDAEIRDVSHPPEHLVVSCTSCGFEQYEQVKEKQA